MAKVIRRIPKIENAILTLDVSSKDIGYAFYDRDDLQVSGVVHGSGDYIRIPRMVVELTRIIRPYLLHLGPKLLEVWVEQPFYMPGKSHDAPIKMTHGGLLCAVHEWAKDSFAWNTVNVSTWRKDYVAHKASRDEKKRVIMAYAEKRFHVKVEDDNHGDALGILAWRIDSEEAA